VSCRREFIRGLAASAGVVSFELVGGSLLAPKSALARPKPPFYEIVLSGSPGADGQQYGKQLAGPIKHNIGFYLRWFERVISLPSKDALKIASMFEPVLKKQTPAALEEMRGIAKGAGVTLAEIVAVNARTDLLVMGRLAKTTGKKAARQLDSPLFAVPGCTALSLLGGSKKRPQLALGQNWDWRRELAGQCVVLRLRRKGAPSIVTFTEAGMVGKIGFNQHGLGVCLNFLSHRDDLSPHGFGVPVHVLLREVMQCKTLDQAVALVKKSPRCASANFLLAQQKKGNAPQMVDLEITSKRVRELRPQNGYLTHTNHFKDALLAPGCRSGKGRSTTNRDRMASSLAKSKRNGRQHSPVRVMFEILRNRSGAPYSVSKSSVKDSPSMTLAGIVMDLTGNAIHLSPGPPHINGFMWRPGA
jgi:isopenicillin-N N-acyltransferase-like protein